MREQLVMTATGYQRLRQEIAGIQQEISRLCGDYPNHVIGGRQEDTQDPAITHIDEEVTLLRRRLSDKQDILMRARPCSRTPEQCESCVHIDTFVLLETTEFGVDGVELSEPVEMIVHVVGYGENYTDPVRGVQGISYVAPFLTSLLNKSVGEEVFTDLPNGKTIRQRIKQLSNTIDKLERQMSRP